MRPGANHGGAIRVSASSVILVTSRKLRGGSTGTPFLCRQGQRLDAKEITHEKVIDVAWDVLQVTRGIPRC
jgi:hypothetical protein